MTSLISHEIADVVMALTAFFSGAILVIAVQSLRSHDPRVNLRAQVIAGVRLANARREAARLREKLDAAWDTADRRLDYLREVAQELGADARDVEEHVHALAHDEALCLALRLKARRLRQGPDEVSA